MKVVGPIVYTLEYSQRKLLSAQADAEQRKGFHAPVTQKGHKIYLICSKGRVIYIGVTNQPIGNRLRYGQEPSPGTGYHGYKWMNTPGKYQLFVWILPENTNASMNQEETIEAEIVYLTRKKTGQWPSGQTEIHFHQSDNPHKSSAKQILSEVTNYYQRLKRSQPGPHRDDSL